MMLEDQIISNKRKSILIFLLVPLVLLGLVYFIGFFAWGDPFLALIVGILISIIYTMMTYSFSEKIILYSVGAVEADPVKHKRLYDIMEGLTIASGMPMPKLYIQKSDQINAFATGKKPENGIVCVTTGALEKLGKDELEGVLAHELAHIKNYDVRLMTITIALIGAISILAQIFLRSLWFGKNRNSKAKGKAGVILLVIGIIFAILAPILAQLIQLAVSRKREFLADATGAYMTRYPEGLARALEKIKEDHAVMEVDRTVSPLYFANPFKIDLENLWSTHPPIEERIKRLRSM
jgi:heat shock protein HtpX